MFFTVHITVFNEFCVEYSKNVNKLIVTPTFVSGILSFRLEESLGIATKNFEETELSMSLEKLSIIAHRYIKLIVASLAPSVQV